MSSPAYDVLVVGAGVVGCTSAYFLAKADPSLKILVVDKCEPGCAASGRAGGFLAREWCRGQLLSFGQASFDLHVQLAAELHGESNYQFRKVDTFEVGVSSKGKGALSDEKFQPKKSEENPLTWLSTDCSTRSVLGTKENTAQVHPRKFTLFMLEQAKALGSVVYQKADVSELSFNEDGHCYGVVIEGKVITANTVVIATGPWTRPNFSKWMPSIGVDAHLRGLKANSVSFQTPVTPATALFTEWTEDSIFKGDPEVYPRPSGEIYVNGWPDLRLSDPPENPNDIYPSEESVANLKRFSSVISAELRGEMIETRACYLPESPKGVPLIGFLKCCSGTSKHRLLIATGHGCWGILNAPLTGKVVSELVVNSQTTVSMPEDCDPNMYFNQN